MAISPIASTRNPTTTGTNLPDWMSGLGQYATPNINLKTTSPADLVGDPLKANISNAPNLSKIADLISQINQQAYLSAPGRQKELENISRWQAGELDPSVYEDARLAAAERYGSAGFGVDSPAWQASIQRALGLSRLGLQEKGAAALESLYSGMPKTDVTKYTLTPSDYQAAQDAANARKLQLAQLQQQGALESAKLAQQRAFQDQEMALKQQEYELQRQAQQAALYAKYGYGTRPKGAIDAYLQDLQQNWKKYGYSGPPVMRF